MPTVSTLLPISFAPFLALMLTATNCTAYMDANGQHSLAGKLHTVPGFDGGRYQLHCLHGMPEVSQSLLFQWLVLAHHAFRHAGREVTNYTAYMDANGQHSLAGKLRTVPGFDGGR